MSRKNKFDLTTLVHHDVLKVGQKVYFVSDQKKWCEIHKMPNNEYKLRDPEGAVLTLHAFAQACLGQEPPNHAAVWVRVESGKTLYDLWQSDIQDQAA